MRRSRYRGLAKTHLQNLFIASAINLDRLVAWLDGRPRVLTRTSRLAMLALSYAMASGYEMVSAMEEGRKGSGI